MAKRIQETSDAETELAECREQRRHIAKCQELVDSRKEELKVAKEEWEAAVARLLGMLSDEDRPLLEGEE